MDIISVAILEIKFSIIHILEVIYIDCSLHIFSGFFLFLFYLSLSISICNMGSKVCHTVSHFFVHFTDIMDDS